MGHATPPSHEPSNAPLPASVADEPMRRARRVPTERLRWRCDPAEVGVPSTAAVAPLRGVVGQEDAVEALRFGLEIHAPGQNVYVRGLSGTGRTRLVRHLLEEVQPACPLPPDRCYVHDFAQPDRPALVTLPRGRGRAFRDRVDELVAYLRDELVPALASDALRERRAELERGAKQELDALSAPFEAELAAKGLALVMVATDEGQHPAVLPVVDGAPQPPEKLAALVESGRLSQADAQRFESDTASALQRYQAVGESLRAASERYRAAVRSLLESEARRLLDFSVREIAQAFPVPAVQRFLAGLVDDVVSNRLHELGASDEGEDPAEGQRWTRRYRVNLVRTSSPDDGCPIVVETQPTLANLVGSIERLVLPGGAVTSDHLMVRGGSLLAADGGYLVLEARDVLSEPGAWRTLVRTLRTGRLEIAVVDPSAAVGGPALKPEPIPVDLKVVLIGDHGVYAALDSLDPDFPQLFKVLVDFDSSMPRGSDSLRYYTGTLASLAVDEGLPHFAADAVAALAEHGARIAGRSDRLTTRFGRLGDLAREAAYLARREGASLVHGDHVRESVRRTRRRADLPARKFRERIAEGTLRIETRGAVVGQVNGLAVTQVGPLTYGFPARITATIAPGYGGTVNIERESDLSGAIHTKGFFILGGLLRHLLRGTGHPLSFTASIAFEQSYGGIDGDSASGAEICCLLSALTGVPLRQELAMTGAIDQFGHVQPIGAVSEKIEGFYDTCSDAGLTGDQGVIVPRSNVVDLMLRHDVVEACAAGRFHVFGVEDVGEALELFTGQAAGRADENGRYPPGTLFARAVERAGVFWREAREGLRGPGVGPPPTMV